jgi:hypothetical protein
MRMWSVDHDEHHRRSGEARIYMARPLATDPGFGLRSATATNPLPKS